MTDAIRAAAPYILATPAPTFTDEILQADALPPEATFNNAPDMLKWLNEAPTDKQGREAKCEADRYALWCDTCNAHPSECPRRTLSSPQPITLDR